MEAKQNEERIYQVEAAKSSKTNLLGSLRRIQDDGQLTIDEVGEARQFMVIITTAMTKPEVIRAIKGQYPVDFLTVRYLATAYVPTEG